MVALLNPAGPGAQIPIDRAVVLIGRSPECDVVLDSSSRISRMHCALVQVNSEYYIRDLGSMNGVTVAGQRIEKDVKLTNGVEVLIGDLKYQFLQNVMPAAKSLRATKVKGSPVFVDETVQVLDVEDVELVDAEIIDAEVIEDVGVIDAIEVEIVDDVEVIDVVEVIQDVEVIEDVEIIEDVEVIDDAPRRSRPRPRLR